MGAKTALLAFAKGDPRQALRRATRSDRAQVEASVRRLHPGYDVEPIDDGTLADWVHPPDDTTYATVLPGVELFCDLRLVLDRPSELPAHLLRAGAGRRIVMHGMHSVSDWLCFAVWEDGTLVRSLSLSPDGGIQENLGGPRGRHTAGAAGHGTAPQVPHGAGRNHAGDHGLLDVSQAMASLTRSRRCSASSPSGQKRMRYMMGAMSRSMTVSSPRAVTRPARRAVSPAGRERHDLLRRHGPGGPASSVPTTRTQRSGSTRSDRESPGTCRTWIPTGKTK